MSEPVDVLVVGAGPTGLMAAIQLRKHGVSRVRVVERDATRKKWAKAAGVQPRSLEILKGLGDEFYSNYTKSSSKPIGLRILNYSRNVEARIPADLVKMQIVEQWRTEKCLEEHLFKEYGVAVEREVSVVGFQDSGNEVIVDTEKQTEKGRIIASYVVACDGAHSIFRKMLKIDFPGRQMDLEYALCQATYEVATDADVDVITLGSGNQGFLFDFPLQASGERATLFDLTPEQKAMCRPGSPSEEDVIRLCQERHLPVTSVRNPTWSTYLIFQSRQASKYRVGRILLAGDAGHVHSPVLGQGMNMGLQDAHNLAWKLALVVNGLAKEALLDTYHEERHEIARKTLKFIERAHSSAQFRHPALLYLREQATYAAGYFPSLQEQIVMTVGQTGYTYGFSSLTVEDWKSPSALTKFLQRREMNIRRHAGVRVRAGERAPNLPIKFSYTIPTMDSKSSEDLFGFLNATPGFQVLVFEGSGSTDASNIALVQEVMAKTSGLVSSCAIVSQTDFAAHKVYGVTQFSCLFLIRPDGYVGLRAEPASLDSVCHYLSRAHCTSVTSDARFNPTDKLPLAAFGGYTLVLGLLMKALSEDTDKSQYIIQRATSTPLRVAALVFLVGFMGAGLKTLRRLR